MLKPNVDAAYIRSLYDVKKSRFQAMIIGEKGVGKTNILKTARKPVWHCCWDPAGEQTLLERDAKGQVVLPPWLIPETCYQANDAEAVALWRKNLLAQKASGVFEKCGTYSLDSITSVSDGLIDYSLERGKMDGSNKTGKMEIQDWGTLLNEVRFFLKFLLTLPCDVIIMGHVGKDKDNLTGRIIYELMMPGSGAQISPTWFSEVYYLCADTPTMEVKYDPKNPAKSSDIKRYLVTTNNGKYKAGTRLGRDGTFNLHEEPDIKKLLTKAGLPTEDKPLDWLTADPTVSPPDSPEN